MLRDSAERNILVNQLQYVLYRDTRTRNARSSEVNPGVDYDSIHVHLPASNHLIHDDGSIASAV